MNVNKMAKIFTGINKLDLLFGEGVSVPYTQEAYLGEKEILPTTFLIQGDPGTCKTTLALNMIKSMYIKHVDDIPSKNNSEISIYFSLEQNLNVLNFLLEIPEILIWQNNPKSTLTTRKPSLGSFDVVAESIEENIVNVLQETGQKKLKTLVIDSISAISSDLSRQQFEKLVSICTEYANITIIISDNTFLNNTVCDYKSFVVDNVINLSYLNENIGASLRSICIQKARYSGNIGGIHSFKPYNVSETPLTQLKIFPSTNTTLQLTKKREKSHSKKLLTSGIYELNKMFSADRYEEYHLGSLAIIGGTGTHKSILALHYLLNDEDFNRSDKTYFPIDNRNKDNTLIISLQPSSNKINLQCSQYESLKKKYDNRINKSLFIEQPFSIDIMPDEFIDRLVDIIIEKDITRVLIDNFAYISTSYPYLKRDKLFIPTLIKVLKNLNVFCVFVDSDEEAITNLNKNEHPLFNLVDNVIVTQHQNIFGTDHILLTIPKCLHDVHSTEIVELKKTYKCTDFNKDILYGLEIDEDAFKGIIGIMNNAPEQIPLFISIYDGNYIQKAKLKIIIDLIRKNLVGKNGTESLKIQHFSTEDLSSQSSKMIAEYILESPREALKIVNLDEYWVKDLLNQNKLGLIGSNTELKSRYINGILDAAIYEDTVWALPQYTDLSFLTVKDNLNEFFEEPTLNNFEDIDIQSLFSYNLKDGKYLFGFDTETPESLVCTFIEFLFNYLPDEYQFSEDKTILRNTIWKLLAIWAKLVLNNQMPYPCSLEHFPDIAIVKQWYGTIIDTFCFEDEIKEGNLRVIKYPRINYDTIELVPTVQTRCTSGTWFWGIFNHKWSDIAIPYIEKLGELYRDVPLSSFPLSGIPVKRDFYKRNTDKKVDFIDLKYGDIENIYNGVSDNFKILRREELFSGNASKYREKVNPLYSILREFLDTAMESQHHIKDYVEKIINHL